MIQAIEEDSPFFVRLFCSLQDFMVMKFLRVFTLKSLAKLYHITLHLFGNYPEQFGSVCAIDILEII